MQQESNTNRDQKQGATLSTCPWQILAKPGKDLTQQQLQFNQLAKQLFQLVLDFKQEVANCPKLLKHYYDKVLPAKGDYYKATKKYIQHIFSVFKTHQNQFTKQEKEIFLDHYFDQIRIFFGDSNMQKAYLISSLDQALPLDIEELWKSTFFYRYQSSCLLLLEFGILVSPGDGKKIVDDESLENFIKKQINDYFIDTRTSKKQQWDNFSITANNIRKELHRLQTFSLRKLELWNEIKKMNNFIFSFIKDPKINTETQLWQTAYENTKRINGDLLNFQVGGIMEKHFATIMELLKTDLIQPADLQSLITILESHIRFMQLFIPDFRLQHRLYLPIIEFGLVADDGQGHNQQSLAREDQKVDMPFLEQKINFYNQKKTHKDNCNYILSKNTHESFLFLKEILNNDDYIHDLYNYYFERDIFIVPETV